MSHYQCMHASMPAAVRSHSWKTLPLCQSFSPHSLCNTVAKSWKQPPISDQCKCCPHGQSRKQEIQLTHSGKKCSTDNLLQAQKSKAAWMQPPVAEKLEQSSRPSKHKRTNKQCKQSSESNVLRRKKKKAWQPWQQPVCSAATCSAQGTAGQRSSPHNNWCNPELFSRSQGRKHQARPHDNTPMVSVALDMPTFLMASRGIAVDGEKMDKAKVSIKKLISKPCPNKKCRCCEQHHDVDELALVQHLYKSMSSEDQSTMLSTCWTTGQPLLGNQARVKWQLLGRRVCVQRLAKLLGTTPRTFYKRVFSRPDKRMFNAREVTNAGRSVDQFFLDIYNAGAAETMPNDDSWHNFNADEEDTQQSPEFKVQTSDSSRHSDFQNVASWEADVSWQDLLGILASGKQLPTRYVQYAKPVDFWWRYCAWASMQPDLKEAASWTTFWYRWAGFWRFSIGIRKQSEHAQCQTCWEYSQFLHCSSAPAAEKRQKALQWQRHLKDQYHDRQVYAHLRWLSRTGLC